MNAIRGSIAVRLVGPCRERWLRERWGGREVQGGNQRECEEMMTAWPYTGEGYRWQKCRWRETGKKKRPPQTQHALNSGIVPGILSYTIAACYQFSLVNKKSSSASKKSQQEKEATCWDCACCTEMTALISRLYHLHSWQETVFCLLYKKKSNQQIILMQYICIPSRSPSSPASPPRYTLCDNVALLTVPKEMKFLGDILE